MSKLKEQVTFKGIVGYLTVISTLLTTGYGFHVYMINQQKQIISQITPEFKNIENRLNSINNKIDNGFKLTYIRDTMQTNAFDKYRLQQAKNESQRVQVLSEILKQVKEREPYFMYRPDTSKKKVLMSNR